MIRKLFTLSVLLAATLAQAQGPVVRGSIKDGVNNKDLKGAVVMLIHAKDSILAGFTRAATGNAFTIPVDSPGRYNLLVTFPGFADFSDEITVTPGENNLGAIPLSSRAKLLEEVVFTKKMGAIKIVGDTTEYAADSFKVKEGATVEDLLKKLPGLQVDKNGKITAHGEAVQKVLVDGEEFFSDDPAVVTKNLQSKAVDAVQVYDKKSDQAIFSGIDDGEKTKTINLKLKENMKRGYFGKINAGGGTDGYFNNEAMINGFKGKRQLSAFGIISNTGTTGLGWEDRSKYGGGGNVIYNDDGDVAGYVSSDNNDLAGDWHGSYNGDGLPTVWTGGLHYANKWNGDKEHLNGNYRFSKNNIETENNNFTQYILPDSQYFSRQRQETFTSGERHGGDAKFEWKKDTATEVTVYAEGNLIHNLNSTNSFTETLGGSGARINSSSRQYNADATSKNLTATFLWKQKLAKKGRNFSVEADEKYRTSDGNGILYADDEFYTGGISDTINQRKTARAQMQNISGKASYTEPLSKTLFATVDYGIGISLNRADRFSYNRGGAEWSDSPDSLYSSSYRYNVITNSGNAKLQWITKKWTIGGGLRLYHTAFRQDDLFRDSSLDRSYNNFAPQANVTWNISKQTKLRMTYSGRTNQPTLDQIQPRRENNDPLNIAIGNPSLKQEFRHNVDLHYNSYKPLSNTYTYLGGSINFVKDAISQTQNTDNLGRRTYQYINVNGNYNGWVWGGTGFKWKKPDIQLRVNGNASLSHATNFVNGLMNESNNNTYGGSLSISKDWEKNEKTIAGIEFEPGIEYNDNHATISTFATSFWNSSSSLEAYTDIFWKLRISTTVRTELRQRTADFDRNNNVVRWDAYISKKFLKKDALEIRASVFDILNQNVGYSRTGQNNYISEQTYNTIRRYGMLNIIWNFTKSPAGAASGAAGSAK